MQEIAWCGGRFVGLELMVVAVVGFAIADVPDFLPVVVSLGSPRWRP